MYWRSNPDLIRGKSVAQARTALTFMPKKSSPAVLQLLNSAVANARSTETSVDELFVKTITVVNNTFGVYINPVTWVNRHRLHHAFSDHPGDPNKLSSDGWLRTLSLCLLP